MGKETQNEISLLLEANTFSNSSEQFFCIILGFLTFFERTIYG
jgi:hypothetical protein